MRDSAAPPRLGGVPVDVLLVRDRPMLVRRLIAVLQERIPEYGQLPAEALTSDITRAIEATLHAFVDTLRTRRLPDDRALAVLRESAARRAEEGIPVGPVLAAYHLGVEVVWNHVAARTGPDDLADLMATNAIMLRYLQLVTGAVAAGYVEERQVMFGDEHAARHAMLTALLDGEPAEEAARRVHFRLPPAYEVLGVAIGPHPDESSPAVDGTVAARRKLRRLRAELDRRVREPVLTSLSHTGGTVLFPAQESGPGLADTVAALARAAGAELTVAAVRAVPSGVAAAALLARDVLEVAVAFGRPPGLYRLDDLLLEYHLSRPSAATPTLTTLLERLAGRPELVGTLTCYLRVGQDRRRTAAELHLHPNTVDHRLRRVAALTGLDPTAPRDIVMIEAALAAARLVSDG